MKKIFWNQKKSTIRGSGINIVITFSILILIIIGAFNDLVAARLEKESTLIIGFFTSTMGIWSYKSYKEGCNNCPE
jgi:hypothetical protein